MNTKLLRQKILDLAIHGKLVPQNPKDEPTSVLLEKIRAEKERLIKDGKIKHNNKSKNSAEKTIQENGPFGIPKCWKWCRIDDIGEVVTGNTPSKENLSYYGNEYPFYKPTDLEQGINTIVAYDNLSKIGFEKARQLPKNTILVTCIGATIGKTGLIKRVGTCNQQINAIIPKELILPELVYFICISNYFQNFMIKNASATTLPIINKSKFSEILIPLPPLSEQQRIVVEINRWFALIDQIEKSKTNIQNYISQAKTKILNLAIQGKLMPQDPNDEPAIELLKRINPNFTPCDKGEYEIPTTWCVVQMQMLCSLTDGEKQNDIERINLDVKFLRGERDGKKLNTGKYVTANSLLILVDGENSGEVFRTKVEGYQGSTFKLLSINNQMNVDYILQIINLHRKILRENKVGSAIPHLNKKLFREIEVPIPPYNEQKRIVDKIKNFFSALDKIQESLEA